MRITITGPRSSGKTTISKLLAKELKLDYISSDEIGERALKKQGGLDKAIKSGVIEKFIKNSAYNLIKVVYKKDNFIFDLSGGSISSRKHAKASEEVRKIAKKNSIVIGLIPSKNINESISFLFKKEEKRGHFKNINSIELLEKVRKDFKKYPNVFKKFCNHIIYIKEKSPKKITNEIINKLK